MGFLSLLLLNSFHFAPEIFSMDAPCNPLLDSQYLVEQGAVSFTMGDLQEYGDERFYFV